MELLRRGCPRIYLIILDRRLRSDKGLQGIRDIDQLWLNSHVKLFHGLLTLVVLSELVHVPKQVLLVLVCLGELSQAVCEVVEVLLGLMVQVPGVEVVDHAAEVLLY